MTAIKKVKDKEGTQFFPVTHERAVRDDDGTTLETKLQNIGLKIGDLANLATTDKSSLVGAINEINDTVSGKTIEQPSTKYLGYYGSDGSYTQHATLGYVYVNVSRFRGEQITCTSVQVVQYAFFKNFVPGQAATLADGTTRLSGRPTNDVIPSDADVLYLYIGNETLLPSVTVTGETGGMQSDISDVEERVSEVETTTEEVSRQTSEIELKLGVKVGFPDTYTLSTAQNYAGMYFNGTAIVASTAGSNGLVFAVEKGVTYQLQHDEPLIYNCRFLTSMPSIGGQVGDNANNLKITNFTPGADGYILVSFSTNLSKLFLTIAKSGLAKDVENIMEELSAFKTSSTAQITALDGRVSGLESAAALQISNSEVKLIKENVLNESDELLTLPIIGGKSYGRFSGVSGKLYTGAANLVRLLLKPGSVTYNGVTLTIDKDGWVTITGTATGGGVISYTNLKGYADADIAKADLTIPEVPSGTYSVGIVQEDSTIRNACIYIRATSSSWAALISSNSPEATVDISSVGAFVVYLINGTAYNAHFRFMFMPSSIRATINLAAFLNDAWPIDVELINEDGIYIANYITGDGTATKIEKMLEKTNYATNLVKCAWFGDSISQYMQLPHLVGEKMAISVDDCSFGGAPLAYHSEDYKDTGVCSLFEQIVAGDFTPCEDAINLQYTHGLIREEIKNEKLAQLARLEAVDFSRIGKIVVFAGTNDLSFSAATLANIKSYFTSAVTALLTAYPQLQIFVVLPMYRSDAYTTHPNGLTLPDINGAIQEVAREFGFPCLDFFKNCGINAVNYTHWLTDGLHQNEAGDEMISTRLANWLNSIF